TLNGTAVSGDVVVDFADGADDLVAGEALTIGALTLDFEGEDGALLRASGNLDLDFFGFASVQGFIEFEKRTDTVTLSDGTQLEVEQLLVGATDVSAFIGVNGGTASELGFKVTDADVALALMSAKQPAPPTPATDLRTFTALKVDVQAAEFVGVAGLTVS